ncbi:MAG: fasciclin domain-containing protein [Lysobacterales bacterium]
MTFEKIPMPFKKFAQLAVLAAAVSLFAITALAGSYDKKARQDIVEVAVSNGSFTTLVAALQAADLVDTLKGDGPFTVFAPTDEAFAKLPAGTVENLLLPENRDQLTAILTYHVVAGKVTSDQVVTLDSATTVNGQDVAIRVYEGNVMINGATVAAADVMASNGVIHVIDEVILPN